MADAGAEQGGGEGVAVLCERARELHEDAGDFDAAHVLYERILALDPGHVETLCNFALLLETTLVRVLMSEPECVCVYVCMYACMYVYKYTHVYRYIYI